MAAETRAKKAAKSPQASKRKATEDVSPVTSKKQKAVPPKAAAKGAKPEPAGEKKAAKKAKPAEEKTAKPVEEKKAKKAKKPAPAPAPEADADADADGGEDASAVEEADDQTQALAKVIDEDVDAEDAPQGEGFRQGQDVGKIPKVKKDKAAAAAKKAVAPVDGTGAGAGAGEKEEPGVVYVGGLPHGFFEHQLKEYFSQFGAVARLRLSRSKRTGASRHYAFLEFEELSTAEIVQRTMDGYLLFGNILRCRLVPKEQVHEDLFKGAGRRFKTVPWNKMAGRELQKPRTEAGWELRVAREAKRRTDRAAKLKELGYEFEGPELKAPAAALKALGSGEQEEAARAIEAAPAAEEKEAEGGEEEATAEAPAEVAEKKTKAKAGKTKKAAKAKKVKST